MADLSWLWIHQVPPNNRYNYATIKVATAQNTEKLNLKNFKIETKSYVGMH